MHSLFVSTICLCSWFNFHPDGIFQLSICLRGCLEQDSNERPLSGRGSYTGISKPHLRWLNEWGYGGKMISSLRRNWAWRVWTGWGRSPCIVLYKTSRWERAKRRGKGGWDFNNGNCCYAVLRWARFTIVFPFSGSMVFPVFDSSWYRLSMYNCDLSLREIIELKAYYRLRVLFSCFFSWWLCILRYSNEHKKKLIEWSVVIAYQHLKIELLCHMLKLYFWSVYGSTQWLLRVWITWLSYTIAAPHSISPH